MLLYKLSFIFVCFYFKIIHIRCDEGSTLAFAIDDTRSMWDDIQQVKEEARNILQIVLNKKSSEVKNFALVTINDPDVVLRTVTSNPSTFQEYLNRISVHNYGNSDCPEMSLTGIEKALLASNPNSYIYVFTDASAKDYHKAEAIKRLCQKKETQVVFVLTGDCGWPLDKKYTVYQEIARATSGQVFRVRKDQVHTVLDTVKIMMEGKHSPVKWLTLPASINYVPIEFKIDDKTDYVLVSTSGQNVDLRITNTRQLYAPELNAEKIMWNSNGKVLKVNNLRPGTYYAWARGSSSTTIVIYARTDFTFEHGFSALEPLSIKDTSKQPIAGKEQHLAIKITDPDHSVKIESVQILDMNEVVTRNLPLRKISDNFYITDSYVSTTEMFKIAVKGVIKATNQPITRISKTAIQPQMPPPVPKTIPTLKIDEAIKTVTYGSGTTLKCEVSAYPEPNIEWFTSNNIPLVSKSSVIEEPTYISYLSLTNIKNDGVYICKATNSQGSRTGKVEVKVKPVFTTISTPAAKTLAQYDKDVKIRCDIKSDLPITIKWFKASSGTRVELSNTLVQSVSSNARELTLKSMDIGMEGNYICEASLNSDPAVKQTHSTAVVIDGLARPVIETSAKKMHVTKGSKIELRCKTIQGYPKPQIKWAKKEGTNFVILPRETSEVLTVPKAYFSDAGTYKCFAENVIGTESAEFEIIMSSKPEVTVVETQRTIPYGSNAEFTCKAESHSTPAMTWVDGNMNKYLSTSVTPISKYKFVNKLKLNNVKKSSVYTCEARNEIGVTNKIVNITVLSPFNVQEHIDGEKRISYGVKETLRCKIQSSHNMNIMWFKQTSGGKVQIIPNKDYDISKDITELTIQSMGLDMDGTYSCEASLVSDPKERVVFSTNVKVDGLAIPEVTYSTTKLSGKKFTAICRIKGVPKPTLSWQYKPKGSDKFYPMSGSEEEFNIPDVKLKDSGVYKCLAVNALGNTEHEFNVVIEEAPVITNYKTSFYGVEGDTVVMIPCNVTGFPDPIITWKKEGKVITKGSKYDIKENILHIKNPDMKLDTGKVLCEARNKLGKVEETFYVTITDTFDNDENYNGDTHNINVNEKTTPVLKIKCELVNSKTRSVRWYRNGDKTNQTGDTYIIERPTVSDDGNYTCRVNTDDGPIPETYVLDVGAPPTFVNDKPSPRTIDWRDDEILECLEESKPEAKIEWTRNGKKTDILNNKQTIAVMDWGEYTCTVSNLHGVINRTFNVVTSGCYIRSHMATQNMPLLSHITQASFPDSITNSDILLKKSDKIKFSCPMTTKSNAFVTLPSKTEVIAECDTEDKFNVGGKIYKYKDLQCKTKVESSIVNTRRQCAGANTELIRIGFPVNNFLEAYQVCYDKSKNVPVYANSLVNLSKIGNGVDVSKFSWSSSSKFNDKKSCETSKKCCYEKRQLLNVDEIAFGPAQLSTFKENLNSLPVWNPCDENTRMSWQTVQNKLTSVLFMFETYSWWTGASNYVNQSGQLVPRYLWQVLKYDGELSAVVYVNDETPVDSDIKCKEACELMIETTDKFVYCCTLNEFSKVFGIPTDKFTAS